MAAPVNTFIWFGKYYTDKHVSASRTRNRV